MQRGYCLPPLGHAQMSIYPILGQELQNCLHLHSIYYHTSSSTIRTGLKSSILEATLTWKSQKLATYYRLENALTTKDDSPVNSLAGSLLALKKMATSGIEHQVLNLGDSCASSLLNNYSKEHFILTYSNSSESRSDSTTLLPWRQWYWHQSFEWICACPKLLLVPNPESAFNPLVLTVQMHLVLILQL